MTDSVAAHDLRAPQEAVRRSAVKPSTSSIRKRSILVAGHKTSISLEDEFWDGLKKIAVARNAGLGALVSEIDSKRQHGNLSSAIRLFVLDFYQAQIALRAQQRR